MHQNVTDLSEKQCQAIELLISGKNSGNIAEALGIHRQTLWRWRQQPEFQAAYQEMRATQYEEMRDLIRETMHLTLQAVHTEALSLKDSDWMRLKKSKRILELLAYSMPVGVSPPAHATHSHSYPGTEPPLLPSP